MSTMPSVRNRLETVMMFEPMPYEVDFTGFLSNTVAVRWMEKLRVCMMRTHFTQMSTASQENLSVISRTHVEYRRPVRYGDRLTGKVWVHALMKSRWEVAFSFTCEEKRVAAIEGIQTGAFIDGKSCRPKPVPKQIVEVCLCVIN